MSNEISLKSIADSFNNYLIFTDIRDGNLSLDILFNILTTTEWVVQQIPCLSKLIIALSYNSDDSVPRCEIWKVIDPISETLKDSGN